MAEARSFRLIKGAFGKAATLLILLLGISRLNAHPPIGYVFSGGGARAYAHVGVLKVLEANGIQPDLITGTSMGAVVGALYAMGYNASQIEEILISNAWQDMLDDSFHRKDLDIGQKRWAPYGTLNLEMESNLEPKLPSGVWVGNNLNLELAKVFAVAGGGRNFDQLPIPFGCVATDLLSGEPVVFREGSLMQAVRASLSIPSIIQPFQYDGRLFIDGGVSQNLPIKEAKEMGAIHTVAIKTNSSLRTRQELKNLIQVLDQTINIGMTRNVHTSLDECDLLLEPNLQEYRSTDYHLAAQIIAAGEEYALAQLDAIQSFKDSLGMDGNKQERPAQAPFTEKQPLGSLSIIGNENLSSAKIKEYLDLGLKNPYSAEEIVEACRKAWNSQLFLTIYPVMDSQDGVWHVNIHVKERTRQQLSIILNYTSEEGINAGAIFKLNNILLSNSVFQSAFTLGGKSEYNVDYVKNFGNLWGSYFRIFHNYSMHRRYYYDSDFSKIASVKAAELGINGGVGIFASKLVNAEAFLYSFRTKLYRDISEVAEIDSLYTISGAGFKAYHESLDDYYFPMTGLRSSLKFNLARSSQVSDYLYSKVYSSSQLYEPIYDWLSLKLGLEIGSWFGRQQINIDPFYLGGSSGYMGYQKYEVSSPVYKIYELGMVAKPRRNLFVTMGLQGLDIDDIDDWSDYKNIIWSFYAGVGFRSGIGPLRLAMAVREGGQLNYYLNLGYDLDVFHFSRR